MNLAVLFTLYNGWRGDIYKAEHARALARMLRRNLKIPHSIFLLTDEGIKAQEAEVDEVLPLPKEPKNLWTKNGINCFRRLRFFDPEYSKQFGSEWVMSMDLDTLILDDVTDIVEIGMNPFGFCIIKGRLANDHGQRPYNGSMWMVRVGDHSHVWHDFDWTEGPRECAASGWRGSDQVWLSLHLQGAPTWSTEHGVYFVGQYLESSEDDPEPRVLNYAGPFKPWTKQSKRETPELYREYMRYVQ